MNPLNETLKNSPTLNEYKCNSSPDLYDCNTEFSYKVPRGYMVVELLLRSAVEAIEISSESPCENKKNNANPMGPRVRFYNYVTESRLFQIVKRIALSIFHLCFGWVIEERKRREAIYDQIIAHFEKANQEDHGKWEKELRELQKGVGFNSTLEYHLYESSDAISCKKYLESGLHAIKAHFYPIAQWHFNRALDLAADDETRLLAYSGLITSYKNHPLSNNDRQKKIDQALEQIKKLDKKVVTTAQKRIQNIAVEPLSDCFTDYYKPHTADSMKRLTEKVVKLNSELGLINDSLLQTFFPNELTKRYALLAHLYLVNQKWETSSSLDGASRVLEAQKYLKKASVFASGQIMSDQTNSNVVEIQKLVDECQKNTRTN